MESSVGLQLLCKNRVKDFATWKAIFDGNLAAGTAAGLTLVALWQADDDPNWAFFLFDVADRVRAEAFLHQPESAELGERSGVLEGDYVFVRGNELPPT